MPPRAPLSWHGECRRALALGASTCIDVHSPARNPTHILQPPRHAIRPGSVCQGARALAGIPRAFAAPSRGRATPVRTPLQPARARRPGPRPPPPCGALPSLGVLLLLLLLQADAAPPVQQRGAERGARGERLQVPLGGARLQVRVHGGGAAVLVQALVVDRVDELRGEGQGGGGGGGGDGRREWWSWRHAARPKAPCLPGAAGAERQHRAALPRHPLRAGSSPASRGSDRPASTPGTGRPWRWSSARTPPGARAAPSCASRTPPWGSFSPRGRTTWSSPCPSSRRRKRTCCGGNVGGSRGRARAPRAASQT